MLDLGMISDGAQFVEGMKLLRARVGNPSLAELNRRSGGSGLPPSTVSEMLHRPKLPPLDRVQKYVRACGLNDDQARAWEDAWEKISVREKHEQLSEAGDHGQEWQHRGSSAVLRDFLKWLSGTPAEVLSRTPAERSGYTGLGGAVLLTAMASALAAAWAVHVVLTPKWRPPRGRDGVGRGHRDPGQDGRGLDPSRSREEEPLYYHPARDPFTAPRAPYSNAHRPAHICPGNQCPDRHTQYTVVQSSLNDINAEYNPLIQRLQNELATSQMQAASARSRAGCELSGGSGCHPGRGAAYAAALKAYQSAEAEVASLQGQISNLHSQQAAAQKNIITGQENQNQEGLLSNLAALNRITDHNKTIAIVRWLLFRAFTLLGCVPAIVKTLKVLEPQNADEKETLAQEDVRVPASL